MQIMLVTFMPLLLMWTPFNKDEIYKDEDSNSNSAISLRRRIKKMMRAPITRFAAQ